MKIPTSSSIILATLAMSSSSSCLAAPTGTDAQDTGMTSSSSFSTSSAPAVYPTGMSAQEHSETIVQRNAGYPVHLESRADPDLVGTVAGIVNSIPFVGPVLSNLLAPAHLGAALDVNNPGSAQSINSQQILALQQAANELKRLVAAAPPSALPMQPSVQPPVKPPVKPPVNAPVNPPFGALSNDDGSGSSSANPAAPGPTESAASDGGSASASGGDLSASAAPASPTASPGVPPNTPVTVSQ